MRLIAIALACGSLAACGGSGGENGPAANAQGEASTASTEGPTNKSDDAKMRAALANPCDFLPKEKVAEAAGSAVDGIDPLPGKGPQSVNSVCLYNLNDGSASVDITYAFSNPVLFDAAEIAARRDVGESTAKAGKKYEDVAGVGDVAYYDPNRKQLTVYRGSAEQVVFEASRRNMDNSKDITIAMAKAAGY